MTIYSHTVKDGGMTRLACNDCGKSVSSPFLPMPTDTPDKGLVVRAWIQCPECMGKADELNQSQKDLIETYLDAYYNIAFDRESWKNLLTTFALSIIHLKDDNAENQNQLPTDGPKTHGGSSGNS